MFVSVCVRRVRVNHLNMYKKEKSLKMKRDVGMACQKVREQGRIKVMVNIQSLIPTSLLFCEKM